jgi:hypothetical protein
MMMDNERWSTVMMGWSYITVEMRGVCGPKKIKEKWPGSDAHRGGAMTMMF